MAGSGDTIWKTRVLKAAHDVSWHRMGMAWVKNGKRWVCQLQVKDVRVVELRQSWPDSVGE